MLLLSSESKANRGIRMEALNADAVFCAVERAVFAGMAEALVRRPIGQALFAQLIAQVERTGYNSKSDAGPH